MGDIARKSPQGEVRAAFRFHRLAEFGEPLNPDVPVRSPSVGRLEQPAGLADEFGNLLGSLHHVGAGLDDLPHDVYGETAQPGERDLDVELVQAVAYRFLDLASALSEVETGQLDGADVRNDQFAFRIDKNRVRDRFFAGLDMDAEGIAGTDNVSFGSDNGIVSDFPRSTSRPGPASRPVEALRPWICVRTSCGRVPVWDRIARIA